MPPLRRALAIIGLLVLAGLVGLVRSPFTTSGQYLVISVEDCGWFCVDRDVILGSGLVIRLTYRQVIPKIGFANPIQITELIELANKADSSHLDGSFTSRCLAQPSNGCVEMLRSDSGGRIIGMLWNGRHSEFSRPSYALFAGEAGAIEAKIDAAIFSAFGCARITQEDSC